MIVSGTPMFCGVEDQLDAYGGGATRPPTSGSVTTATTRAREEDDDPRRRAAGSEREERVGGRQERPDEAAAVRRDPAGEDGRAQDERRPECDEGDDVRSKRFVRARTTRLPTLNSESPTPSAMPTSPRFERQGEWGDDRGVSGDHADALSETGVVVIAGRSAIEIRGRSADVRRCQADRPSPRARPIAPKPTPRARRVPRIVRPRPNAPPLGDKGP